MRQIASFASQASNTAIVNRSIDKIVSCGSTKKDLTSLSVLRYGSGHRKRWFKNPIPIGARPGEVIAADSTTINLLKLLLGALRLSPAGT